MDDNSGWFRANRQIDGLTRLSIFLQGGTVPALILLAAGTFFASVVVLHSELVLPGFKGPAKTAEATVTERVRSNWGAGAFCTYVYDVGAKHYQGAAYGGAEWARRQPERLRVEYLAAKPEVSRVQGQRRALFAGNWLLLSVVVVLIGLLALRGAISRAARTIGLLENGTAVQATVHESPENTDSGNAVMEYEAGQSGAQRMEASVPVNTDDPAVGDTTVLVYDPGDPSNWLIPGYHPSRPICDATGTVRSSISKPLRAVVALGLIGSVALGLFSTGLLDPSVGQPLLHSIYYRPGEVPPGDPASMESHPKRRLYPGGHSSVRVTYSSDQQALLMAVRDRDADAVADLLEKKPNVNATGQRGQTVLHEAAEAGSPRIISMLIAHGARPDAVDAEGQTALFWAAGSGRIEAVEQLIKLGANPNVKDKIGWTPLHKAARDGRAVVAEALLDGKCHPNIVSVEGSTALHIAATEGNVTVVKTLTRHRANVDVRDHDGRTPLICAAACGKNEVVDALIGAGADVNLPAPNGSALEEALNGLQSAAAARLVSAGAEVNKPNKVGELPLIRAAEIGAEDLVKLMIAKGAKIDAKNRAGDTALHEAVHMGRVSVIRALLKARANPDTGNYAGRTPLYLAAGRGDMKAVRLLVNAGARATQKDRYGESPLDCAKKRNNAEIVKYLQSDSR